MRYSASAIFAVALLASAPSHAAERTVHWQKIGQTSGFQNYRAELQRMVNSDGRPGENVFYIAVEVLGPHVPPVPGDEPPQTITAYVYWPSRHELTEWGQTIGDVTSLSDNSQLDLRRDVVKTEDDIKGSTFLVTRAWASNIVRHCLSGDKIVLTKGPEKPAP